MTTYFNNTHLVSISDSLALAMSSLSLVSCLLTLRPGDRLKVRRLQSRLQASRNVNVFQCKDWLDLNVCWQLYWGLTWGCLARGCRGRGSARGGSPAGWRSSSSSCCWGQQIFLACANIFPRHSLSPALTWTWACSWAAGWSPSHPPLMLSGTETAVIIIELY